MPLSFQEGDNKENYEVLKLNSQSRNQRSANCPAKISRLTTIE